MVYMKLQIRKVILGMLLLGNVIPVMAQKIETDPVAVAAIWTQTTTLETELAKSATAQMTNTSTNAAITLMVDSIRKYDKIMLDYLQKANNVFNTIYYAADALEMGTNIVKKLGNLMQEVKNHPQGALVTAVANDAYKDIIAETGALVPQIANFVQGSGKGNLLTSAERMDILYDVHAKLRKIDRKLNSLCWSVQTMRWSDLGRVLNPDMYWQIQTSEKTLERSKKRVDRMINSFK